MNINYQQNRENTQFSSIQNTPSGEILCKSQTIIDLPPKQLSVLQFLFRNQCTRISKPSVGHWQSYLYIGQKVGCSEDTVGRLVMQNPDMVKRRKHRIFRSLEIQLSKETFQALKYLERFGVLNMDRRQRKRWMMKQYAKTIPCNENVDICGSECSDLRVYPYSYPNTKKIRAEQTGSPADTIGAFLEGLDSYSIGAMYSLAMKPKERVNFYIDLIDNSERMARRKIKAFRERGGVVYDPESLLLHLTCNSIESQMAMRRRKQKKRSC